MDTEKSERMRKVQQKEMTIGIVGGMGTYATIDFFRRLADAFPAEKEWDRPRIIVDNYCTMPSRVRALLYNEHKDELIQALSTSVRGLIHCGANLIILACNTSHCFLPDILDNVPEAEGIVLNIIEACGKSLKDAGINSVDLVATEGTIEAGIYSDSFLPYGITVHAPTQDQYPLIRSFIEAVKQKKITESSLQQFASYISGFEHQMIVLGCTEIPILYQMCKKKGYIKMENIIDPLQCAIDILTQQYTPGGVSQYNIVLIARFHLATEVPSLMCMEVAR